MMDFAGTCAEALIAMGIDRKEMQMCKTLFMQPALCDILENPTVSQKEKAAVIARLFPKRLQAFWSLVVKDGWFHERMQIMDAWDQAMLKKENRASATLFYVTPPDEKRLSALKELICGITHTDDAVIICKRDDTLIGGYRLQIGDIEYDKSIDGAVKRLQKTLTRR